MRRLAVFCFIIAAFVASPASAKVLVSVDKSSQQMTVYVDGERRWVWPVSTGVPRYDTPSGRFTAFRMEKDHLSKEWDDAPMPYSIFFTTKGHAIHGTNHTSIGDPASHGCVRLSPDHAAQLFALVQQQGVTNTTVVLTGDVQVAWARRATRLATTRGQPAVREPASLAAPVEAATDGYAQRDDTTAPRYSEPPRYAEPPRVYGRTYDNGCPPPPPGFPAPACNYGRAQTSADGYPPRRYGYGQPRYEAFEERPRFYPYGY
jgi:hypothetical protein